MMQYRYILFSFFATFMIIYDEIRTVQCINMTKRDVVKYTTRFDDIDIDKIVKSRRLLVSYANCLLEKGPCTPEGKELKKHLPDAIATQCVKCSDIQKKQAGKIFSYLLQYHRDLWNELLDKYDPDGQFRKQYEIDDDD